LSNTIRIGGEKGRTRNTNRDKRNAYGVLVGKPEGKRSLERRKHMWEDNIELDLR
jgi:hypothetical protein